MTGIQLLFWKKNRGKLDQGSEEKGVGEHPGGRGIREVSNKVRVHWIPLPLLFFGVWFSASYPYLGDCLRTL